MRGLPFFKPKKGAQFAGLNFSSGGSSYTLSPATASTLGGVKIGSGVSVNSDGTISVASGYNITTDGAEFETNISYGGSKVYGKRYTKTVTNVEDSITTTGDASRTNCVGMSIKVTVPYEGEYFETYYGNFYLSSQCYGTAFFSGENSLSLFSSGLYTYDIIIYYTKSS